MSVKHIVDFYFNTDGNYTEHRISIKVTLAPKRILLKWQPSTKKSEAQPLSSTGQAEKVVIVNCEQWQTVLQNSACN